MADHVPVVALHGVVALGVLAYESRPQLGSDGVVEGPSVLPQDELDLPEPVGLQESVYLLEGLEGLLLAGGRLGLYYDVSRVHVGRKYVVYVDGSLLLEHGRQHVGGRRGWSIVIVLHGSTRRLGDQHAAARHQLTRLAGTHYGAGLSMLQDGPGILSFSPVYVISFELSMFI